MGLEKYKSIYRNIYICMVSTYKRHICLMFAVTVKIFIKKKKKKACGFDNIDITQKSAYKEYKKE